MTGSKDCFADVATQWDSIRASFFTEEKEDFND
jgi:hypothetical protein